MNGLENTPPTREVDTVENLEYREFFDRYLSRGKPVHITAAMRDWPALSEWLPQSLRARVGNSQISVIRRSDGLYDKVDTVQMNLAEYLDILDDPQRREGYYLNGLPLGNHIPELMEHYSVPDFIKPEWAEDIHFWVGYNSRTVNHFHSHDEAILCQVVGQKRVILFSPDDTWAMYPKKFLADDHNCSYIDPVEPDYEKYPRFKGATPYECILNPGEMLFIPIHWWHGVYGLELSISGTFFWGAPLREYRFPNPAIQCGMKALMYRARKLRHLLPNSWRNA